MTKEEKIKEIVNSLKREDGLLDIGKYDDSVIEKAFQEYGEWVRQQTLEEAEKCVPEEWEPMTYEESLKSDIHRLKAGQIDGIKYCRQQTLSNLRVLKNNNK